MSTMLHTRIVTPTVERPPARSRRLPRVASAVASVALLGAGLWGVSVTSSGSSPSGSSPTPHADILSIARFLGLSPAALRLEHGHSGNSPSGMRMTANVRGVGMVQWDPRTHEVNEVIFDNNLATLPAGTNPTDKAAALRTASAFAAAHFDGFSQLVVREVQLVNHELFTEWQVLYQARTGDAWAPRMVRVGVNARDGRLAYYWSSRLPDAVSAVPHISMAQAATAVRALAGPAALVGSLSLEITATGPGTERLVWVTTVTPRTTAKVHVSTGSLVWVDAQTGAPTVVANFH
ncbi:MAG: hypothetical protein QOC82_647 [Frankiaceae bacterium]|jgi:hypothetical protein|nr:hypothetical protein [Frankiaceae bacterium]MDQ1699983.1 hypothetical protein [Frankiaceae bacterium]